MEVFVGQMSLKYHKLRISVTATLKYFLSKVLKRRLLFGCQSRRCLVQCPIHFSNIHKQFEKCGLSVACSVTTHVLAASYKSRPLLLFALIGEFNTVNQEVRFEGLRLNFSCATCCFSFSGVEYTLKWHWFAKEKVKNKIVKGVLQREEKGKKKRFKTIPLVLNDKP